MNKEAQQETQNNVSSKLAEAMHDLHLKAQRQEIEKENNARLDNDKKLENELEQMRKQKLENLKKLRKQREDNVAIGHGELRLISQDEVLPFILGRKFCVVHFFHREFEKCKVMSHHLKTLCKQHVETGFAEVDAEKAPFFVERLGIKVLPSVCMFIDGEKVDTLVGFQGLTLVDGAENFVTRSLEEKLGFSGVIKMEKEFYEDPKQTGEPQVKNTIQLEEEEGDDDW
eukprot:snap_masked-scaffold_2-processed-gene-25.5-mRNA-1 protein AED:0.00 eAED:0.00 QI:0/-1/0/1/-1/1/1/0/227